MRQKIMNESKYKFPGKTRAEILDLEQEELMNLRSKDMKDLTIDEMGRYRRLLFRKNPESETLKDHVDVLFNSTHFANKPSTFTESFYFSDEKNHDTNFPDLEHHFRKSFMLTFDVEKMKQKYIIRK